MIIELLNGEQIDIGAYKLRRLFHFIPMLQKNYETQRVLGGLEVVTDQFYDTRFITVRFMYDVADIYDFYAMRDQWNDIFVRDEPYFIIFKREAGKKWLVRSVGGITVEPNKSRGEFELEFRCEENFSRSRKSVQDLIRDWDANQLQFGMGYDWDVAPVYTFKSGVFTVENLGNAPVDSRDYPFKMEVRGNYPNGFAIHNGATDERFTFNGALKPGDIFILDGVVPTLNGKYVVDMTNMAAITLQPGLNHMFIMGEGTIEQISFDFFYLYK